jgi:FkbM family methyltransferase
MFRGGVIVPFVGDTRLILQKGMSGATGNYYCGLHEFQEMGFLLHFLREGDVFADIGANVGSYSILSSGVCGAESYSFEPCSSTYQRLCDNIRINDLLDSIQVFQKAAGAKNTTLRVTESYDTTNHILLETDRSEEGVEVSVIPLDVVFRDTTPLLIKIDVEGFETEVVKGAANTLCKKECKALIMEVGGGVRYGFDENALHSKIVEYGFEPCVYDPFTRALVKSNQNHSANALFIKDCDFVNERLRGAQKRWINGVEL